MQPSGSLSSSSSLSASGEALLRHFPEEVRGAYVRLRETGDPAAADTLVLAIVADHMSNKTAELADSAALMADLGFDSVAIAEMVFFIEDLLQVSISNAEIVSVKTVGELRAFVRTKLAASRAGGAPGATA